MSQRNVYFDNSATTKVMPEVIDLMVKTMSEDYGNPSSKHIKGVDAERYYLNARKQVADTLKVKPKEIIFTSGGTESDNMAIIGAALAKRRQGKHIITTNIEHAAVYKTLDFLAEEGWEISYLKVDDKGHIRLSELKSLIRPDTVLVSIMYVNNEIGAVQDIAAIGALIKECNPKTLFHTDAIQAYGKLRIRPKQEKIDLMAVSGHKLHGPKGIGFLYIDEKVTIRPIIYGGGQQDDMRSGTHNIPGIAGLGLAAQKMYENFGEKIEKILSIKDELIDQLSMLEGVTVNSEKGTSGAPQVVSASFEGVRAEVLLHALEEKGIYVSSGSACSSNHPAISGTLRAIGVKQDLLDSTLRFSIGIYNEPEDITYTIEALKELLPVLRRFTRR